MWSPVAGAAKAAPLTGGYQSVPVYTISRGVDYLLSAYTACPTIESNVEDFFNSTEFSDKADQTATVRSSLGTLLNMSPALGKSPTHPPTHPPTHTVRSSLGTLLNMSPD